LPNAPSSTRIITETARFVFLTLVGKWLAICTCTANRQTLRAFPNLKSGTTLLKYTKKEPKTSKKRQLTTLLTCLLITGLSAPIRPTLPSWSFQRRLLYFHCISSLLSRSQPLNFSRRPILTSKFNKFKTCSQWVLNK